MAIRHRIIGEMVTNVFEGKLEPLREANGVGNCLGPIAEKRLHFRRAL